MTHIVLHDGAHLYGYTCCVMGCSESEFETSITQHSEAYQVDAWSGWISALDDGLERPYGAGLTEPRPFMVNWKTFHILSL